MQNVNNLARQAYFCNSLLTHNSFILKKTQSTILIQEKISKTIKNPTQFYFDELNKAFKLHLHDTLQGGELLGYLDKKCLLSFKTTVIGILKRI